MPSIKLTVGLILATVLVVFGAQNTQSVTFHFLMFDAGPAPVIFVVFAAALVGALLSWIVSTPGRFRGMRRRRDLEHQVAAAKRAAAAAADMEESRSRHLPPTQTPPGQA